MKLLLLMSFLTLSFTTMAQKPETIKLWSGNMPNSNGITTPEKVDEKNHIWEVSNPEMIIFKAAKPNGQAIIECPGGGYQYVSMNNEGYDMTKWFNEQGITFIILKYRMPNEHNDVPLSDIKQAMKIVNAHAKDWKINQIGIMGASAGGHLASTLATHFTPETRPDFQVLLYPVITMDKRYTHKGTHNRLIGINASAELENEYSNEKHVTKETPQAFILHCTDDPVVPVENSINYYTALVKNHVSASLHIYPQGGHGWGFNEIKYKEQWKNELKKWLQEIKLK